MTDAALNPTDSAVQADTPCFTCGYNLRGLRRDATCPECGADIAPSLRGDGLHNRSPAWIGVSSCGAAFISLNAILAGVMWIMRLGFTDLGLSFRPANPIYRGTDAFIRLIFGAVSLLLLATGVYWLTRREPFAPAYRGRWLNAATVTRAALFVWIVAVLWQFTALLDAVSSTNKTFNEQSFITRVAAAELARFSLMICVTIIGLRLARRMRAEGIVTGAWCLLLILVAGAAAHVFNVAVALNRKQGPLENFTWAIALTEIAVTMTYWWCLDSALNRMRAQAKLTTDDAGEPLRVIQGATDEPAAIDSQRSDTAAS